MKTILPFALVAALTAFTVGSTAAADTRCYELRIYYAAPGKLDALNTRFRDHTCQLFEKHGMVNIGYWLPVTNSENKLVYLLAYPAGTPERNPGRNSRPILTGRLRLRNRRKTASSS